MTFLSTTAAGILKPEEIHDLIVQPTQEASVAMSTATVVPTGSSEFRFLVVTNDASTSWYLEGEDITLTDPNVEELVAKPKKIASLTKVSRELAEDSSPEATALVGASVARDMARKIDAAWFAASTPKGPAGLASLIGTAGAVLGGSYANADAFAEADGLIEQTGSTPTVFVSNASTVLALSKLKYAAIISHAAFCAAVERLWPMAVEFRLLGDVEARFDGRRLEIGSCPPALRARRSAGRCEPSRPGGSTDRSGVGGPAPAPRPQRVGGLLVPTAELLAGAGDVQIVREPGGYVLTADALSVDLHLFRHLAAQARATGDPLDAAALFDRALDLWRGEPFASLDTPWIDDVRTALEAERLSVVLDRNDAALRAGRHAELLGELAAAAAGAPARRTPGRAADAGPVPQRPAGRRARHLPADARTARRGAGRRSQPAAAAGAPADPRRRSRSLRLHLRRAVASPARTPICRGARPASSAASRTCGALVDALREGPLVTLTGVGGVGKTRLALEVAGRDQERFGDGVWLCELAPLDDGAAVGHAVAATLRLQQRQGLGIEETVIEYLRARELLLVVDNCEHVLDAAAQLLDQIVRHCPRVSVLATSREALGVEGERILPVPPLPVEDATVLFADRARAGRPDFDLEHEPVGAVAEICRRLDGLPLAIELAAARMRAMSSLDVARRLDRLRLLSGGARGAHPAPAEPHRDDRLVLPAARRTRAGAVRAAVGVRGRVRPRGGARRVRRRTAPPRTTRSSCSPGWSTSRW